MYLCAALAGIAVQTILTMFVIYKWQISARKLQSAYNRIESLKSEVKKHECFECEAIKTRLKLVRSQKAFALRRSETFLTILKFQYANMNLADQVKFGDWVVEAYGQEVLTAITYRNHDVKNKQ